MYSVTFQVTFQLKSATFLNAFSTFSESKKCNERRSNDLFIKYELLSNKSCLVVANIVLVLSPSTSTQYYHKEIQNLYNHDIFSYSSTFSCPFSQPGSFIIFVAPNGNDSNGLSRATVAQKLGLKAFQAFTTLWIIKCRERLFCKVLHSTGYHYIIKYAFCIIGYFGAQILSKLYGYIF